MLNTNKSVWPIDPGYPYVWQNHIFDWIQWNSRYQNQYPWYIPKPRQPGSSLQFYCSWYILIHIMSWISPKEVSFREVSPIRNASWRSPRSPSFWAESVDSHPPRVLPMLRLCASTTSAANVAWPRHLGTVLKRWNVSGANRGCGIVPRKTWN